MLYDIVIKDCELRLYLESFIIIINITDLIIKPPPPLILLLFKELFFSFFILFLTLINYKSWLCRLSSGYISFQLCGAIFKYLKK